jgi:hydrogenase-1 operon protein HyaF
MSCPHEIRMPLIKQNHSSLNNTLLHEIHHALVKLLSNNEETLIELRNLPLNDDDKHHLLHTLGKGEVTATLNTLGHSLLWESAYPGVWIIEHYNTDNVLLSHLIAITWVPLILKSQPEDVQTGLQRLAEYLRQTHSTKSCHDKL